MKNIPQNPALNPAEETVSRTTHSDPTANAAIGRLDREMKRMRRDAEHIGLLYRTGRLSYEEELAARRRFTGIYRPMLERALRGA